MVYLLRMQRESSCMLSRRDRYKDVLESYGAIRTGSIGGSGPKSRSRRWESPIAGVHRTSVVDDRNTRYFHHIWDIYWVRHVLPDMCVSCQVTFSTVCVCSVEFHNACSSRVSTRGEFHAKFRRGYKPEVVSMLHFLHFKSSPLTPSSARVTKCVPPPHRKPAPSRCQTNPAGQMPMLASLRRTA